MPLEESPLKRYRIATIPGDGIGKEVVPAGRQVLEVLARALNGFRLEFEDFGWGGDYYRRCGTMMPADGLDALRSKDAILFGSAGDRNIPDHITLWGLRLKICQGLDQYANVRPARILPGIDAPLKRCATEGPRLGDRAREHRGRVLGRGRPGTPGDAHRGRDRCYVDDARGSRTHPALCLSGWRNRGRASS